MSDSQSSQDQIKQYLDLLNQQIRQPTAMPTGTPDDGSSPSWTGLLGRALSGGQAPGYQLRGSQADTSGNRALLNFGIQTLLASGPSPIRSNPLSGALSAVASGLQGAQESLGQDQQRAAQLAAAQYSATRQQQQDRLAALKEALPLLTLQQQQASLTALKGGGTATAAAPGTGDGGFTGDKEKDRALIVQRESHGDPTAMNYVAKEDPTAWDRGATATGKYQFVTSTWQEGLKLAGIDPSKYPRAMDAPESVQDQVFDAVYAKHGNKPWVKGAKDWVKDENGKYQLATVRPQAGGATPPATPGATPPPAAPPAPPGVQVGGVPPPPPGGAPGAVAPAGPGGMAAALPAPGSPTTVLRETQQRGPDGQVRTVVVPTPATSPPTAGTPSGQQVSANVGAILGGMDRASTATPASAMPMVGGPGAGPSAQPQPPAEAGWGAGTRATGYGGGSPPPGVVAPATPAAVPPAGPGAAPPAAAPPPVMATPPPFTMRPLTPTEAAATSYDLDPQTKADLAQRLQAATTVEQAEAVKKDEAAAIIARRREADTARLAIEAAERTAHNTRWDKQQEQAAAVAAEQRRQDAETARVHATAAETRLTNKEAVVNSVNQKGLETANAEQASSIAAVRQLEGFRSVSEMVGQPGWLQTTKFPGSEQSIAEKLQQLGYKVDDTQGVQLMRGAMTNLTRTLREGMPMGALSDRDLSFIERMGPTEWMDPETRIAAVDYLQKAFRAKQRFAFEVQSAMGKGMNHGDALDAANAKVKDFVPRVSPELSAHWTDNSKEWSDARLQWAIDYDVRPGTMFHFPNGSVAIMKRPKPAGAP